MIIEDGVCKLADRSALAGSVATMDRLIRTVVQKAEIPLEDAVRMASETPAVSWVFTTAKVLCNVVRCRPDGLGQRFECTCCLGYG